MDTLLLALRVIVSLGAVVLLLWLVARRVAKGEGGLRGLKARGAADPLRVVARRGVGQKASVVVVETAGQRFLLGVTEHGVNVLHTAEVPASPDPATEFASTLAAAGEAASEVPLVAVPRDSTVSELPLRGRRRDPLRAEGEADGSDGDRQVSDVASFRTVPGTGSALDGSVFSTATWKQAGAAIRKGLMG